MKLNTITENDGYSGLEDRDKFKEPGVDFLPIDRTLEGIVRDLNILTKETAELQREWNVRRAESIVRSLMGQATLLRMLTEKQ